MDDMQLLYSRPIRPVAAFYLHDDQSEAVMVRWGLIPSWAEGQPASPPTGLIASLAHVPATMQKRDMDSKHFPLKAHR
jgi:putative SOS response-associated peptidase YedK